MANYLALDPLIDVKAVDCETSFAGVGVFIVLR
jgi:hypothetical protein